MKLSQQHFQATDLHVEELVRDTAAMFLKTYNYGLLPPAYGTQDFSEITLSDTFTNSFDVRVKRCNAITAGGCRIAINPEMPGSPDLRLSTTVNMNEGTAEDARPHYYVVLRVNPFKRIPFGQLDQDESPLRQPFSDATYQLDVVPINRLKSDGLGPYTLIIGQLLPNKESYRIDQDFIPPATSMNSHPRLVKYKDDFEQQLNMLMLNSRTIVRNVNTLSQPTKIARNVRELSVKILDFLVQVMFNYRNLDDQHPPIHLLDYFNNLTSILLTALDCLPEREKDEVLQYFNEWSSVSPNAFEETLRQLVELNYKHYSIGASMQQVAKFLSMMGELWENLSKREFIGQHKDNFIVQETNRPQPPATPPGRRWSSIES